MATIKSIRRNFRKTFIKLWVKEGFQKKAKPGALKEMTGKFNLKKQTYFGVAVDTKNKVRNK